jgi:hypothetical protein
VNRIILLAALASVSGASAATAATPATPADAPSIQGAWTGRIGNGVVNACFMGNDGQYFYQRDLKGIALSSADGSWQEPDGAWKIERVSDTELEGVWLGSGKRLTIHLERLGPLQQDGDCGPAYYAPVVNAVKYDYDEAKIGTLPVRIVKSPLGQAFELMANSEAARQINDFSLLWLQNQAINAFRCKANGGEEWQSELTASKMVGNYLLVAENEPDNYCGGPHGNPYHANRLFDLRTGQAIDTYGWLNGGKASVDTGALRKLIEKLNTRGDCGDVGFDISAPIPSPAGLLFSTFYPHASRACNEDIEVGFAKLAPYLSPEGKAFVKGLKHQAPRQPSAGGPRKPVS